MSKPERCPQCGVNFAEFPELKHDLEDCDGPECTCYEFIGGHQMGCPLYRSDSQSPLGLRYVYGPHPFLSVDYDEHRVETYRGIQIHWPNGDVETINKGGFEEDLQAAREASSDKGFNYCLCSSSLLDYRSDWHKRKRDA